MRRLALLVPTLALALAACGPKVRMDEPFVEEDDPRAGEPVERAAPTYEELPEAPPRPEGVREGTVARADLVKILDQSPAAVLRHIEVTVEHADDRFIGWRLVAINPEYRGFDGVDLLPGDILIAVNGRALVKPDDLQAVWESLRTASELLVDLRRADGKVQLRWTIVDAPAG